MPGLDGSGPPRVYHLMADGVSKGAAVAHDLRARGLVPAQAIAVGDSSSDLEMAATVGRMHLVGNALRHPDIATLLEDRANANTMANVVVEPGTLGAGWTTAVTAAIGASEPSAR
jgi:hydroxymethylpyrimidine pyrophosphatase-like HAD family hydrolase